MSNKQPRIAIAHEFLVQYGGAEKTLEAIAELFPEAPIYTAKFDKKSISKVSPMLGNRNVIAPTQNFVNKAVKYLFTFMMAPVFENMNFKDFDIIISDGNTWNKGIILKPNQLHITYIHTPPRFLYGYSTESTKRDKWYFKLPFSYVDNILRLWDFVAAQRPEYIVCNSNEIKARIKKFYRREATVIYPPAKIEVNEKEFEVNNIGKPYYVAVGRIQKYKNFDMLINAFNLLGLPLTIVGGGEQEKILKAMAGPNITFTGTVSNEERNRLMHNALGLINPVVDEDFGIVPVEALSHGTPVLAHRSGGHLETIIEGVNGMFFDSLKLDELVQKMKAFDSAIRAGKFNKQKIVESTERFSKARFQKDFLQFVMDKWELFQQNA